MRKRPNKEKYRYDLIPKHLLEKVTVDPVTGCWNFKGSSPSSNGYERCWLWGIRWQTHRLFYELVTGVDIRHKQLDHLCVNRKCCNPEHMDPVTPTTNAKRIFRRRKGPPEFVSLPAEVYYHIQIAEQEFKQFYLCDFKPDERETVLEAEFEKYYIATETCDNKTATRHWKELRDWCRDSGYTQDEVNRAKRRVAMRLGV